MQILLHDDVASAGKLRIFTANESRLRHCVSYRVLGSIHESQKISGFEVAESMHFVGARRAGSQLIEDGSGQLEAQIEAKCTNVEQKVTRSGRCESRASFDGAKRMQVARPSPPICRSHDAIPGGRADSHDAGQLPFE